MMKKCGFTVVELLVITAIIGLLTTILFPVFAQARALTHPDQTIDNLKHLEHGQQMYYADYDNCRSGRQTVDSGVCEGWRQIIYPYVHSSRTFEDRVNESGQYLEMFSIQDLRNAICPPSSAALGNLRPLTRSYYWNNVFQPRGYIGHFDTAGLPISTVESPETVGDIVEGRAIYDDNGPFYQGWVDNIDAETSWFGAANPSTGMIGSNLSGLFHEKGEDVAFMDGHVHPMRYSQICSQFANIGADADNCASAGGCQGPAPVWRGNPNKEGFWNFSEKDIEGAIGSTWAQFPNAVAQYCTSMPKANQ